jgi:hypothetical protein
MKKGKHQNTYKLSDGSRMTKSKIDSLVRLAKAKKVQDQLNEHGFNFCEDCFEYGRPKEANDMDLRILDNSHNISVDRCQKESKSELAWDLSNITIRCRYHHRLIDKTN